MVEFDPQKHHRRSIRLKGFDYSQPGTYFVTIVAYHRQPLFGAIVHKKVIGIILITGERRDAALLRPCYNNHHSRKVNVKHGLWGEDNEKPIIVK